jgi:hypothetical protein
MKKYFKILTLFGLFSLTGCGLVDSLDKPDTIEGHETFKILLKDNSGFMEKLYGKETVPNASVFLKSSAFDYEINAVSDTAGIVTISGVNSDNYHITASRNMTADEMLKITGVASSNYKLTNQQAGVVTLNASNKAAVELKLDQTIGGSPIVLSELYVCGPSGSGLYFHDKYIEVYNQSDSVQYLDKIIVAFAFSNNYLGISYPNDPTYAHIKSIWMFPGTGKDYPIKPGQYIVCAEDAIDHRVSAPNSIDLSKADFEFYKNDAPDIDNPNVPNMIKINDLVSAVDWVPGGEKGAIILAKIAVDSIQPYDDHFIIPYANVLDGVEYMLDVTKLDKKIMSSKIDAGAAGGIQFYTGKSMERILINADGKARLKDDNNSSLDFHVNDHPTPGYHY